MMIRSNLQAVTVFFGLMLDVVSAGNWKIVHDIPGRAHSVHYTGHVRTQGATTWHSAHMLETSNPTVHEKGSGYFSQILGWTHSWFNIEMGEAVEVLIQRLETPIQRARVHPESSGARIQSVGSHGVVVSVPGPCQFMVDFDGGLDEVHTGEGYDGPPMHTVSVFANPIEESPPDPSDSSVYFVKAGDAIPLAEELENRYTTLLFGPGVHKVPRNEDQWRLYHLPDNVRVYLPSDAILHTALLGRKGQSHILEGYGTITGEDLERCPDAVAPCTKNTSPHGIGWTEGAHWASIRGVTLVDFPQHHLTPRTTTCDRQSILSNVKVLGWRANGDGVHVFGHWKVEKMFVRSQDDAAYLHSINGHPKAGCEPTTLDQITTWNDVNGASFILLGSHNTLTNSDVIYQRSHYTSGQGGHVFNHRDGAGEAHDLYVKHVRVEDPLPTKNHFQLQTHHAPVWNLRFKHITLANYSAMTFCSHSLEKNGLCKYGPLPHGMPELIWSDGHGHGIYNNSWEDVKIAGEQLSSVFDKYFTVSGNVTDIWLDGVRRPDGLFLV